MGISVLTAMIIANNENLEFRGRESTKFKGKFSGYIGYIAGRHTLLTTDPVFDSREEAIAHMEGLRTAIQAGLAAADKEGGDSLVRCISDAVDEVERVREAAADNPELPKEVVEDALKATDEAVTPYQRRTERGESDDNDKS